MYKQWTFRVVYISILDIVTEEQFYIKNVKMPFVVKHYMPNIPKGQYLSHLLIAKSLSASVEWKILIWLFLCWNDCIVLWWTSDDDVRLLLSPLAALDFFSATIQCSRFYITQSYINNLFVLKERHSFRMHDNDTYLIFIPILVLSSFRTSCCFSHNYLKSKEIQMFISKCYISCQDFFT
jgi:hypothetical protein